MNKEEFKNPVFVIGLVLVAALSLWGIVANESFTNAANAIFGFLTTDFGWLYLISMLSFVIFAIAIAVSKYGSIKLGPDDSKPEYSTVSWFAMLFGCGMGVGLVFWGIAEPISHYIGPMAGYEPSTPEAARFAMSASFMHWGIHPWANYAVVGLALAYFQFRKGKPGLISTALEPLVGAKNTKGGFGKFIDILAVFATVAGVVTSLGLGVLQINAGLNYLFGVPNNLLVQIVIIVVISVIYIGSSVLGIEKGIKVIGDVNLYIAVAILLACFIVGPKIDVLNNLVCGIGDYIGTFFESSLGMTGYGDNGWMLGWRIFYWAWWIAWAPFVGVFIARISKGRTVREFVAGVVLVPAVASILWFAVFGSMGLSLAETGAIGADAVAAIAAAPETGLFTVLGQYPLGMIISIVTLVLICTFFITSANSGTFVLGMLSSRGNLNPPSGKKILWGVAQSALAVALLMAGGLKPLQTISIAAAFPFIFIMLGIMVATVKAFAADGLTPNVGDPDFVLDPDYVGELSDIASEAGVEAYQKVQAQETTAS